jgi:hypothetical protein
MIRLSETDIEHMWAEVYDMGAPGLSDYFRDWFEHDWLKRKSGHSFIFIQTEGPYDPPSEYFDHVIRVDWSDWHDEISMVFSYLIELARNSLVLYDYDQVKADTVYRAYSNPDLFDDLRRFGFKRVQSDVGIAVDLSNSVEPCSLENEGIRYLKSSTKNIDWKKALAIDEHSGEKSHDRFY